jgi:hypothetical protein
MNSDIKTKLIARKSLFCKIPAELQSEPKHAKGANNALRKSNTTQINEFLFD